MKHDIAERWVAKLRSGEIEQGTGYLGRSEGERCCLGVLCDMAVEEGVIPPPVMERGNMSSGGFALLYSQTEISNGEYGVLPEAVVTWAQMKSTSGVYAPHIDGSRALPW